MHESRPGETWGAAGWRRLRREEAYVGGRWIGDPAGAVIQVRNPADGALVGVVPTLEPASMGVAIDAAQAAFPAWRDKLPIDRADVLMRWRDLILENREALAALMTMEQGKPLADARGEVEYGASFIRWFAAEASRLYGETIPSHLLDRKLMVQREPLGVVGLVTPWNFPSAMLARKAAAALAVGCTAICVPSAETPFSALALAALAEEAGLPAGVFSVLTGSAPALVSVMCADARVRGLSFTGSTSVGRMLLAQCAATVKRVSLELGGHAPFLVLADADLEAAAAAAVAAKYQTSGQDCLAANRIFVHRSLYEPFVAAFGRAAAALRVGDGFDPDVQLGPLINGAAVAKCAAHVEDALSKGARLIVPGGVRPERPLFYHPTVLADVTADMAIAREETFGPVAALMPFDDEDAVVARANDTEYGLVAYVFTRDLARAHRLADRLEYGMVAINTVKITGAPIPFGGVKQSGQGREGSRHGVDEFTEQKYICIAL